MGIAISDEHLELSGVAEAFLSRTGALADLYLLARGDDLVLATRDEVTVAVPANTDATRRVGTVTLAATPNADRVLVGARATAVNLGRVLAAAEATGGAQACVTMASE